MYLSSYSLRIWTLPALLNGRFVTIVYTTLVIRSDLQHATRRGDYDACCTRCYIVRWAVNIRHTVDTGRVPDRFAGHRRASASPALPVPTPLAHTRQIKPRLARTRGCLPCVRRRRRSVFCLAAAAWRAGHGWSGYVASQFNGPTPHPQCRATLPHRYLPAHLYPFNHTPT